MASNECQKYIPALKSRNKHNELRKSLLRAAIYLVNCLVKKSDFGLIAAATVNRNLDTGTNCDYSLQCGQG